MANRPATASSIANATTSGKKMMYRPAYVGLEFQELLENEHLTDDDVIRHLTTASAAPFHTDDNDDGDLASDETSPDLTEFTSNKSESSAKQAYLKQRAAYRMRRVEILELSRKLPTGAARIDAQGRLVRFNPFLNDDADQEPLPRPRANPPPWQAAGALPRPRNEDEYNRQWLEQEELHAKEAITRAVQRYREQDVPDDDLEIVAVAMTDYQNNIRFTIGGVEILPVLFRWLRFILTILTGSFVMLAPRYNFLGIRNYHFEHSRAQVSTSVLDRHLMQDIFELKLLLPHEREKHCAGLNREDSNNSTGIMYRNKWTRWWEEGVKRVSSLLQYRTDTTNCADGVLHIPARHVVNRVWDDLDPKDMDALHTYLHDGFQKIWRIPCANDAHHPLFVDNETCPLHSFSQTKNARLSGSNSAHKYCSDASLQCFRGVHDNFASDYEIRGIRSFGARLIQAGGDHWDILYNTSLLGRSHSPQSTFPLLPRDNRVANVVEKIHQLLVTNYLDSTSFSLAPVAFRVHATAPFDGNGVKNPEYRPSALSTLLQLGGDDSMSLLLNWSNYKEFLRAADQRNGPVNRIWPVYDKRGPERGACHLMADVEADPRFFIQSSLFLSTGAGQDYTGGTSLYVDHDDFSPKIHYQRIRRGLSLDGARARLVVSTGGIENRRCHLPVRSGVRAALQIWWELHPSTNVAQDH